MLECKSPSKSNKMIINNDIKRKFSTMLPLDVSKKLLKLAKETSNTGFDKFDYGVTLRILFERAELNNNIKKVLNRLDSIDTKLTIKEAINK